LENIYLQQEREVAESYQATATPIAVLVRPDGAIGSSLAPGADQIRALLRSVTGDLDRAANDDQSAVNADLAQLSAPRA